MPPSISIQQNIRTYYDKIAIGANDRYRSWEHCYSFFRQNLPEGITAQRDIAALHLGFYLASWGMYRGSSFLLKYDYTVHLRVVDCLATPQCSALWENDFGAADEDRKLVPIIQATAEAVRDAYKPFGNATDTLVTKVILGTFGCLPACDRYFRDGFKSAGFKYSSLNDQFVDQVLHFCRDNLEELLNEQARIKRSGGISYPLMKLIDMYFWQIGCELEAPNIDPATQVP